VDIWQGTGSHGGGDALLLNDLFEPAEDRDVYGRAADHRAGAFAALTGIAANRSMGDHRPATIASLIHNLDDPFR
jgi:hypothetical protein